MKTKNVDVFNVKFINLIDFDEKIFLNKNENLIFCEKELKDLEEIHDVKAPKSKDAEALEVEMISLKVYEEEKKAYIIYGATVAALALVLVVATGKVFF